MNNKTEYSHAEVIPVLPTEGWEILFDGQNLDDWAFVGSGDFVINEGTLMSRGKTGLLWYKPKKFGQCVVRVVYKVSARETSSAVFVQIPEPPQDIWQAVNRGHQIKICDFIDEYRRTGSVYSMSRTKIAPTNPPGQWNTLDIFLQGQDIKVYVNNSLVTEYESGQEVPQRLASSDPLRGPRPATGYIGLQNHNDMINDVVGRIWFKEVKVLSL